EDLSLGRRAGRAVRLAVTVAVVRHGSVWLPSVPIVRAVSSHVPDETMPSRSRSLRRRDILVLASVAAGLCALVCLVTAWLDGPAAGTVTRKDQVITTSCSKRGLTCTPSICYQITYVIDSGSARTACVAHAEFDRIEIGQRFPP